MNFAINGVRYHIDLWGAKEGSPLLLLHGFTGNSLSWRKFEPYWKEKFSVAAIDIIGHGQTDSPEMISRYGIEAMADDIYTMMLALGIEKIDVLGYSMGGRLALTYALKYPQTVRKLILESASPGLQTEVERAERRLQDEVLATKIKEQGLERFIDFWENVPLFQSQKSLPDSIRLQIREERLRNNEVGLINSLRGMGTGSQPSWWCELHKLSMPVFLMTGSKDEKFCRIAEKMLEKLKNGQWKTIENCGHAIHVEKPEIFDTIVSEFLSYENG